MTLPIPLQKLIDNLQMLPGIGPRTAQRLAFYMLRLPEKDLESFGDSISSIKKKTMLCSKCFHISGDELCSICKDDQRDETVLCVVETSLDVIALEKSNYKGYYHVLNGVMNPMVGVGPEELFLFQLLDRIADTPSIQEVVLATSTSLEGEATALYILKEWSKRSKGREVTMSRIGKGLPLGADIEYADDKTLSDALLGRTVYKS